MAKRISELPSAVIASESDIDAVVQSGITRKRTLTQLRAAIVGAWGGFIGTFLGAASESAARSAIGAIGSTDNIDGNAGSADKLATARNIAATGDVAWNVNFDGTVAVTSVATVGRKVSPAYIEGLQMTWVSANALTIQTGSAYIESLGTVLSVAAPIVKTGLSLAAATKFHVYLYSNAGTPDIELSTTAPSAKVYGNARTKTGDTSRRYIGTIFTGAVSTIIRFKQSGTKMFYLANFAAAPLEVLTNGTATVSTAVAFSGCVPETAVSAQVIFLATHTNASSVFVNDADMGAVSSTNGTASTGLTNSYSVDLSLSASQTLNYIYTVAPTGGGAYLRTQGYTFER